VIANKQDSMTQLSWYI